jgi:hypothetical protein
MIMEPISPMLRKILANNNRVDPAGVKNVLILYEEEKIFIGDTLLRFDQLRICNLFFKNAAIDLSTEKEKNAGIYTSLLKGSPVVRQAVCQPWSAIAFNEYDVVIAITYEEKRLLKLLEEKYTAAGFSSCIFSSTVPVLITQSDDSIVFPMYPRLMEFAEKHMGKEPPRIYLSQEDRRSADKWLEEKGLRPEEELYVVLDSTTTRDKMLTITEYEKLLDYLLQNPNARLLIFDEKKIGKAAFYAEWLGKEKASRIIFSEGLRFRDDLALLGASQVKLILGPCTGLLHCAAAVYTHFLDQGMPPRAVPLMITYTGRYQDDYRKENRTAFYWWGNSPLVSCLVLKEKGGIPVAFPLQELSFQEQMRTDDLLKCTSYTAGMITEFIHPLLSKI